MANAWPARGKCVPFPSPGGLNPALGWRMEIWVPPPFPGKLIVWSASLSLLQFSNMLISNNASNISWKGFAGSVQYCSSFTQSLLPLSWRSNTSETRNSIQLSYKPICQEDQCRTGVPSLLSLAFGKQHGTHCPRHPTPLLLIKTPELCAQTWHKLWNDVHLFFPDLSTQIPGSLTALFKNNSIQCHRTPSASTWHPLGYLSSPTPFRHIGNCFHSAGIEKGFIWVYICFSFLIGGGFFEFIFHYFNWGFWGFIFVFIF